MLHKLDEAAAACERTDSDFESSSPVGNLLSHSIVCYRKLVHERNK